MTFPHPYRSTVDSAYSWECLDCGHIGAALVCVYTKSSGDFLIELSPTCTGHCAECGSRNLSDDLEPPEHEGEPLESWQERNERLGVRPR